jgi:signal transduction histidine kinase
LAGLKDIWGKDGIMLNETSLATQIRNNSVWRYGIALLATAVALGIGGWLGPALSSHVPHVAVFIAIALSALYCGLGPSLVSSLVGLVALKYWFIPPLHSLNFVNTRQILGLCAFLAASAIFIFIGELSRRENMRLVRAQESLEDRVRQRTRELQVANQSLRELSTRLMQLQDDERRRIARELHDSIGQLCAALAMNLTTVGADIERLAKTAKAISDSAALVQEMNREVRTISYLLHPPLLDESGLASALRWYVDGFSERSKIRVDLDIPEDLGRFSQELETAVFRTVQECLTNIHRHSGSPVARVRLAHSDSEIYLAVEDEGSGIAAEKVDAMASGGTPGVGIRGMRERLRQLNGDLQVRSDGTGTRVEARLPIPAATKVAA